MRAIEFDAFGDPSVLQLVKAPNPGIDEKAGGNADVRRGQSWRQGVRVRSWSRLCDAALGQGRRHRRACLCRQSANLQRSVEPPDNLRGRIFGGAGPAPTETGSSLGGTVIPLPVVSRDRAHQEESKNDRDVPHQPRARRTASPTGANDTPAIVGSRGRSGEPNRHRRAMGLRRNRPS
jgi:hypothetical protein